MELTKWISRFYKKKSGGERNEREARIKKKSPTEVIENTSNPQIERAYLKVPGREMTEVTINGKRGMVQFDKEKIQPLLKEKIRRKVNKRPPVFYVQYYPQTRTHTHLYDSENPDKLMLPSHYDLLDFLDEYRVKTMMIAQQDIKTKKVMGYFVLRKTKKTPELRLIHSSDERDMPKLDHDFLEYMGEMTDTQKHKPANALRNFAQKYHLSYRFIPAECFEFEESTATFKKKGLENKVAGTIGIVALLGSALFLSTNLTGNAIGPSHNSSNVIGLFLFLLGTIGIFFYLRKKRE